MIENGDIVKLDYETFVEEKLIDSSTMTKPIEFVMGKANIYKQLEKELLGKDKGFTYEFSQKVDSKSVIFEVDLSDFDDESLDVLKTNKEIDFRFNDLIYPCKVKELNTDKNKVVLEYSDPFAGKTLLFKIKVKEIKKSPKL